MQSAAHLFAVDQAMSLQIDTAARGPLVVSAAAATASNIEMAMVKSKAVDLLTLRDIMSSLFQNE